MCVSAVNNHYFVNAGVGVGSRCFIDIVVTDLLKLESIGFLHLLINATLNQNINVELMTKLRNL